MGNKGNSSQRTGSGKVSGNSISKGKGNYTRSDSNGRTTTTSSAGSPGHKK